MNQQLATYMDTHLLLDEIQHGFRKGHSTESALIVATELIKASVDKDGRAALILLDLFAAFDTVIHDPLIDRLEQLGKKLLHQLLQNPSHF